MSGIREATVWLFFLIIYFLEIISVRSEIQNFDEHLYKLANRISREYFQAFKCVTFAVDAVEKVNYLEKRVPVFLINLSEFRTGKLMVETFEQGCGGYIIQTNAERRPSMVRMLLDAKNETVSNRYNRQKYIFLPMGENDTDMSVLFESKLVFLPNFLLVSPSRSGTFSLITHSAFDPGNVKRFEVIDTWTPSQGYAHGRDLFPDKIKNINGRKLLFGVMNYVPYTVVIHDGNRTIFDGLEKRIAVQFVKMINGTYDAFDHPVHLWGTKFPNGSGNGIFGSVQRGDADLGYAAFYQWYCDVLDCTFPYVQAEVSCLVPKPQILMSWQTILLPFTLSTWISLFATYAVSTFFMFGLILMISHLKGTEVSESSFSIAFYSAYKLFRLQMQQTPKSAHESNPIATFIKISYLYYFLVALFWQGGIASILTIPRYEKPINTAFDLVSRYPHVKWGANHDTWIHSIENSTEPVVHEIVKKFVTLPTQKLIQKAKTRDFAFFIEKLNGNGHFGFNEYINRETVPYLRKMKNYVYTAFTVIVLPRGSPYLEKLDNLIHRMIETGIILKMETQVSLEVIDNHLQTMIRFSEVKKDGKATLTLGHIKGPIYIYFTGIVMSMVTLVGETYLFRCSAKAIRRKKISKVAGLFSALPFNKIYPRKREAPENAISITEGATHRRLRHRARRRKWEAHHQNEKHRLNTLTVLD